MIQKTCECLINYFCEKNLISDDEKELYIYSAQVLLQFIITFICVLISGVVFNNLFACLILFVSFSIIRKFSGGIHSKKFIVCFFSSIVINFLGLHFISNKWFINTEWFILILTISLLTILLFKPVIHPNKSTSEKEQKYFKLFSGVSAIIFYVLFLLHRNKYSTFAYSIATGEIIATIMFVFGKIKYRNVKAAKR